MVRLITKVILLSMVALTSCYYDVDEVLNPVGSCNTTAMSYQTDIAPILERNCYSCHRASVNTGGITLEGHAALMNHVTSGRLVGAINHQSGFSPMPQGAPKLAVCDIDKIEQWIADGSPNN